MAEANLQCEKNLMWNRFCLCRLIRGDVISTKLFSGQILIGACSMRMIYTSCMKLCHMNFCDHFDLSSIFRTEIQCTYKMCICYVALNRFQINVSHKRHKQKSNSQNINNNKKMLKTKVMNKKDGCIDFSYMLSSWLLRFVHVKLPWHTIVIRLKCTIWL